MGINAYREEIEWKGGRGRREVRETQKEGKKG